MGYEAYDSYYVNPQSTYVNSFQRTLAFGANAGDVILAYVEWDDTSSEDAPSSLSSSTISWASVHVDGLLNGEGQAIRTFRGKVNNNFSANTEVVTVSGWTDDAYYVGGFFARFSPSTGALFATEPVQQSNQNSISGPNLSTATDGLSVSVTTTGDNQFQIVGFCAHTTEALDTQLHAGTNYTQAFEDFRQLNDESHQPFMCEHRAQASAGTIAVTFTQDVSNTSGGAWLGAFALEEYLIGGPGGEGFIDYEPRLYNRLRAV